MSIQCTGIGIDLGTPIQSFSVLRLGGRKFEDLKSNPNIDYYPFRIENCNGRPIIQVEYKKETKMITPEEILSKILVKMNEIAQVYIGRKVSQVVIGVLACFNYSQRRPISDAAFMAGLSVQRLIIGSTLAGAAFGFQNTFSKERNVLVFYMGGGTCNVSILTIENNGHCKTKSTAGNTELGGDDFDSRMIKYFIEEFQTKYNKNLSVDKCALRRLRTACESTKIK
ncbi:unnamed protein product [Rotaria socialis]|uniref:Heat shock protein 70 n=1 Tax=Rotaria socialis TaxID=392032 RepID=A0A821JQ92_9BILA|nr:unnamed protein product [Rotaria socialis]CAF4718615.1 unnamed protein product [Rotaria socialis]